MDIPPPPPSRQLCSAALAGLSGRTEIVVDWMWDSLRLGDGGEYGEAWTAMHDRFKRGLENMLEYYGNSGGVQPVVILVTHGAGCNALLGALTRKPVLTDIPISSLSMAVLKPTSSCSTSAVEYDLVLQAGTSHLGFPGSSSSSAQPPSIANSKEPSKKPANVPDKQILEYHPIRSRSTASYQATAYSDPPNQSTYQPPPRPRSAIDSRQTIPNVHASHASGLKNDTPRRGLWTSNSLTSSVDSSDDEAVATELGWTTRGSGGAGLWRSWAGEGSVKDRGVGK